MKDWVWKNQRTYTIDTNRESVTVHVNNEPLINFQEEGNLSKNMENAEKLIALLKEADRMYI